MTRFATMTDLQEYIGKVNKEKGWDFDAKDSLEKFYLMIEEIIEAGTEYRTGVLPRTVYYSQPPEGQAVFKPEGIAIELADCVIRIMHYCENFGIDLQEMIELKMRYNETRPFKHGKIA